jgi:hypothetical protein
MSVTNLGQMRHFSVSSCSAPDEVPVFATYLLITIRTQVGRSHHLLFLTSYNCLFRSFQESQAKDGSGQLSISCAIWLRVTTLPPIRAKPIENSYPDSLCNRCVCCGAHFLTGLPYTAVLMAS